MRAILAEVRFHTANFSATRENDLTKAARPGLHAQERTREICTIPIQGLEWPGVTGDVAVANAPHMNTPQAQAFRDAAKWFRVYILVRRTNPASLQYVGKADCVPKRLDCKAKTADSDFTHPAFGKKQVAGLVVDPTITGRDAFVSDRKFASAQKEWNGNEKHPGFKDTMLNPAILTQDGQRRLTYIPSSMFYFVDLDPASLRYGCVKFTSSSLLTAGKYIHGDFDLYGIVRADDPARNVAVMEKRLSQTHARSPEFFDVQHFVNRKIGAPMVLHGGQESYGAEHSDEGIDVFTPEGGYFGRENLQEIVALYENEFKGRRLFTKQGPREVVRGMFMTPG